MRQTKATSEKLHCLSSGLRNRKWRSLFSPASRVPWLLIMTKNSDGSVFTVLRQTPVIPQTLNCEELTLASPEGKEEKRCSQKDHIFSMFDVQPGKTVFLWPLQGGNNKATNMKRCTKFHHVCHLPVLPKKHSPSVLERIHQKKTFSTKMANESLSWVKRIIFVVVQKSTLQENPWR